MKNINKKSDQKSQQISNDKDVKQLSAKDKAKHAKAEAKAKAKADKLAKKKAKKQKKPSKYAPVKCLIPYIKESKWLLVAGVLSMMVIAGLTIGFGQAVKWLVDMANNNPEDLAPYYNILLLGMFGVILVYGFASFYRMYSVRLAAIRVTESLRKDIFDNIIKVGPNYIDSQQSGNIQTRIIADTTALADFLARQIPLFLKATLTMIGAMAACFYINSALSVIILVGVVMVVIPFLVLSGPLRRRSRLMQAAIAETGRLAGETFRRIKVVHAFSRYDVENDKFGERAEDASKHTDSATKLQLQLSVLVESLSFVFFAVLFYLATTGALAIEVTMGDLMALGFYVQAIVIASSNLVNVFSTLKMAVGIATSISEYLDVKNPVDETPNDQVLPEQTKGRIEFRNVHFHYPSRPENQVLNGLNLVIEAHSKVALVGESGAGKSTLLELLMRIYDPQQGQILIDGVDIRNVKSSEICKHIGYMPQQDFLASGTVWDNICYGNPDADEAAVNKAIELACAKEFIEKLPEGLQTDLGEVGSRLSGGQRQRISLARAILKEPQIVLFDEANSGLDAKSEAFVDDAMNRLSQETGMTMLSVTHKIASAKESDSIAVLSKGTIANVGTHDELLQCCSIYKKLAGYQSQDNSSTSAAATADVAVTAV